MKNNGPIFSLDCWNKISEIKGNELCIPVKVSIPARFDFIGGWTDTPPYYFDNPAAVLNSAITIDSSRFPEGSNEREIEVSVEKSEKMAVIENSCTVASLSDNIVIKNVFEFAGISEDNISVKICNIIPHGSGLGGSSLYAFSLLSALLGYYRGIDYVGKNTGNLINNVLLIEQLMGSGGGWQDQLGGVFPGIKLIETTPENKCNYSLNFIENNDAIKKLNDRSLLIDSLIQRKASRILYSIRQKYIERDPRTVKVLDTIHKSAITGYSMLNAGDIDNFAALLCECWERVNEIETGSIEFVGILRKLCGKDLSGYKIGGAGGGGFILAIFENNEKREYYKKIIHTDFPGCRVYCPSFGAEGMIMSQNGNSIKIGRTESV